SYTDLPFLLLLRTDSDAFLPDRYLRASDIGASEPQAAWKCTVWDARRDAVAVPAGSVGHRWEDNGTWNLDLGTDPTETFRSHPIVRREMPD
ncbi:MAG: hypothetical protein ACREDE_00350, partial [Thermoplasmata archaeon]